MKKITLLLALITFNLACFAQVNTYTFASSTGTYTPLSGGTALKPPGSSISGSGWFCQNFNVVMPFVFYYNGIGYSDLYVNSNGYLTFGKPALSNRAAPHSINDGQDGSICAFAATASYGWTGGALGAVKLGCAMDRANSNPIRYSTLGSAPNRVFVVEWTDCYGTAAYFLSTGTGSETVTFQIRLSESTNNIDIVYNTSSTSVSRSSNTGLYPTVGLLGASTIDFNLLSGSSFSSVTNNTFSNTVNIVFEATSGITAGTTFTFTPPSGLQPTSCSGAPSGVVAIATHGITCGPVGLGLINLPLTTGLNFKWQSSNTGLPGSWSDISGASGPSCVVTPTATTYYQCVVGCGSGTPVASTSVVVGYESSCPTMPSYTYNGFSNPPYANIGLFTITSGSCSTTLYDGTNGAGSFEYLTPYGGTSGTQYSYSDMTLNTTHIKLIGSSSGTTSYTATLGNMALLTSTYGVWMDINDNGSFGETGEYIGSVSAASAATNFTLTIPANAFGVHRMRLRSSSTAYSTSTITPTGLLSSYGETHDYMVEVVPPAPTASSNSPVCVTGNLNLISAALTGATYTWSGPLSYYSTTTSATQSYSVPSTSASGTYTLFTTVNGATSCTGATTTVTVNPQPTLANATNSSPVCATNTLSLFANSPTNVTGYAWVGPVAITSSGSSTATVPGATPLAGGIYSVTVNNGTGPGCTATYTTMATVNPLPAAISGTTSVCIGTTSTLSSSGTGTWSTSDGAVATVGPTSGVVSGVTAGTATITYTLNSTGCYQTVTVTVNAPPGAIGGGTSPFCPGATTTLTNGSSGGIWTSGNTALATINPSTGMATGVSGGSPDITYTLSTGCFATKNITVITTPAITGGVGLCAGTTSTLSNTISGGTWASSNPSVATIGSSSGVVSGLTAGSTIVTYTFPSTCTITTTVNVTSSPSVYAVSGGGTTCSGTSGVSVILSGSDAGVNYQLYIGGVPTGTPIFGTGTAIAFTGLTAAGTYTIIANPGTGCATTMSGSAAINVYASPNIFSVSGGGGYCSGGTGVHIYLSGSNPGINYQLYNGASAAGGPIGGSGTIIDFGLLTAAGTYTVTATNATTGCVSNMVGSATVTINPAPAAYTVTGSGNYCTGGAGLLVGVVNSEFGVNYQLYRGGVAVGSPVAGVGGMINFGMQTVAGSYTVIGTNATTGCTATMTGAANIAIVPLPTIYNVTGGGSFCSGGTGVAVGLSGSSTGVNYQLYRDGTSTGSPVAGTGAPLSFGNQTAGGVYTVMATGSTSCTSNMLGSATVIVNPLPASFGVTGGGAYCAGTGGLPVGLSGSEVGTSYYLYRDGTLIDASSGTSAALNFGLHTVAGVYTVSAIIPGTGCAAIMGGSVTISINPLPTVYPLAGGGSYCTGGSGLPIALSSSQPGVDYIMSASGDSMFILPPVPGTGSGFIFGTFPYAGTYVVTAVSTTTGCVATMGTTTITKNPLPTAYTVTGGGNYCAGGTGVNVGLSNSNTGISYQLYLGVSAVGSPVAGTGAAISFGLKTATGTYTVVATNTTTGCINAMSGSVVVGTIALPAAFTVTGGGNYCAGGAGKLVGLSNSATGVNYQLYRGTTPVGGAMAGTTGSPISFGLQTTAGVYTVKAVNPTTSCTANMTGSVTITIDPLPGVFTVTGGGNYCSGGSGVNVGLSNSVTGISYQLYNGGTASGLPMAGSGFALDFGLKTATGMYTVTATNTATGCTNAMNGSATININSLPVAYLVTGGGNYCAGSTGVHVGLVSSAAGVSYQLYLGSSAVGSPIAGTGAALDFGAQTMAGTYTVKATNTATSCVSTMLGNATVVMNPLPAVYIVTGGGNYCIGGVGLHVGLTNSQTGVDYQLYNGGVMAGGPMAGTGAALDFGFQTGVGTYTVVATNTITGCTSNMGGSASIAISTMPTVYTVTGGGNYCPTAAGSAIGLSNSDIGVNYQVYNSSSLPVGSVVAGTGSAIDMGIYPMGVYSVVATGTGTSCTGNMFGTATVTVVAAPAPHNVVGGGNYCAGDAGLSISLDGSDIGNSYQLYLSGVPVGAPIAGTGLPINFGLQTAAGSYSVMATGIATTCTSLMTGAGIINVDPLPAAYTVSGGGSYCSGGMGVNVSLNGSVTGVDYELYNGVTMVMVVPGSGSVINFGPQTGSGAYTVKAVNSSTGCFKWMTGTVNVNINLLPTAFGVTGGGSYCAGGTGVNVKLNGSQAGVMYQLYRNGIFSVGSPLAGTGAILDFGLQTLVGTYTVVATNASTMCINNMSGSATVTPMPLPVVYNVSGSSAGYCPGSAGVSPIVSGSDYGVTYQLYRGSSPIGIPLPGTGGPVTFAPQTVAGSYTVVGTNTASGCVSNMTGGAGVIVYPSPTMYTVTGGGSYCSGGSGVNVGLSGSDIGTNYQLFIGGAPGPIMLGTGSALSFGLQATGGYYTVKATNATGCTTTMTGSASVTINALPTAYNVTGGGNYCSGGTGVFVGLSGSTMGVNYQLYVGSVLVSSMAGTGSAINFGMQTSAGSYTITATNTTTGCSKPMNGSATVGVNTSPTVYAVVGGGSYCAHGAGVNIGIAGSDAAGVVYRLHRGTTLVAGPTAGTGAAMDFGLQTVAGNYTVTATNTISGCVSTMGSTTVAVNAVPVSYTVTGGGSYCAGATGVHIGLSNSQPGVNYDLMLSGSSGATMPGSGSALDFGLITTAGTYTVVATHASTGCTATMSASATVTVNPAVIPSVTISTGVGDTVCTGMLTTFAAITVNGGTAPSYVWTINGIPVPTIANSYSYLPLNGDVVGVQLTSSAACATPATASASMTVHVNIPQTPSVSVGVNPGTTVCQGTTTMFTAVPAFGGSAPTYRWMKNNVNTGVTASTYSYTPANGDNITCIVFSNYRCRLRDSAVGSPIIMSVSAPATPVVTINATPGLNISAGYPLALTATASNAGSTPTYQWKVNGIAVAGAVGETYINNTYEDGDQVTCEVSSSGTCAGIMGSKTVTVRIIGVGVNDVNTLTSDIKLLPNPNKGTFTLKGTWGVATDAVTVEITNMLGQVIYSNNVAISNGTIDERIQLSNTLANGMYLLNLRSGSGSKVFHLVVEQ
ncbi:MAG: C-terminal target protein [Flavipsychrobacter sp.]|jgi:hypothetical protein|nr:C-terminal target protein [Flavipsychrobacter sp.]